ncbi:glycosyltransferase family 2 protein [Patescibacteria group bacterium]|nr:glycosyltransferase family 2 protein [Patescibacteria group bacterium]MBU4579754.1 glycosyltransferase family 2 protein [Patescibacteria group bacterium]
MQTGSEKKPDLSIVILCYRSGKPIKKFIDKVILLMQKNNISEYELILVGNYLKNSNDETPKIVAEIACHNPKIKFSAIEKKGMMGWDMKSGLRLAAGNYIAVIDGDDQMPAEDLIKVYGKIKEEKLDLVKTYRIKRGDDPWRKIISTVYNLFFKILFPGLKSQDINSKPKIFSREAYKKLDLISDDWFIDAEIMILARRLRLKIGEIPTFFLGLRCRRSFVKPSAIFEFIKNLIIFRIKEFKHKKK